MAPRRLLLAAVGLLALPAVALWNRAMRRRERPLPRDTDPAAEPVVVEHVRDWATYLRGFDAHHGPSGSPDPTVDPAAGDLRSGLATWVEHRCLRGYTIGAHVYVCPDAPRVVRVHQAGHAPAFGEVFEPLAAEERDDGGLPDEPLHTLDVMLPGAFPHTFLRRTDRRGLAGAYRAWFHDGRLERVHE